MTDTLDRAAVEEKTHGVVLRCRCNGVDCKPLPVSLTAAFWTWQCQSGTVYFVHAWEDKENGLPSFSVSFDIPVGACGLAKVDIRPIQKGVADRACADSAGAT